MGGGEGELHLFKSCCHWCKLYAARRELERERKRERKREREREREKERETERYGEIKREMVK